MEKGSQLSHEVINLAWSLLWGKETLKISKYWIGMELVLTKKRKRFWVNVYRRKGTLDISLPER